MVRIGLAALTLIVAGVLTVAGVQLLNGPRAPGVGSGASPGGSAPILTPDATATPSAPTPDPMTPEPTTVVDPSGILLVDVGEPVQGGPVVNEERAMAFSRLLDLAMAHRADLGYPFEDPGTHVLVISAATDAGRALAEEIGPGLGFPFRIRDVDYSQAELEQIGYDSTMLVAQGVPDADLIYEVIPDWRDNRTLIVIREKSQPLLEALAQRFAPDAIAIQVDPRGGALTGY